MHPCHLVLRQDEATAGQGRCPHASNGGCGTRANFCSHTVHHGHCLLRGTRNWHSLDACSCLPLACSPSLTIHSHHLHRLSKSVGIRKAGGSACLPDTTNLPPSTCVSPDLTRGQGNDPVRLCRLLASSRVRNVYPCHVLHEDKATRPRPT